MAEIHVTAMANLSTPSRLSAVLGEMTWPSGEAVPVLILGFGRDTVRVWPADPNRIRELAKRLEELANQLEKTRPDPVH